MAVAVLGWRHGRDIVQKDLERPAFGQFVPDDR